MSRLMLAGVLAAAVIGVTWADTKPDPGKWEAAVAKFEAADKKTPPKPGEVLFVGSSSIVKWKLAESFPDLPVTNRGFGGSRLSDVAHFADRLLAGHQPRVVVAYAGDNDIGGGQSAEDVRASYRAFHETFRKRLPTTPLLFVSIKPSPARWKLADVARKANGYLKEDVGKDANATFVDVWPLMLGANGEPRPELYVADKLHMSPEGYVIWTKVLRPLIDSKK